MTTWAVLTTNGIVLVDADYYYTKDARQLCLQNKGEQYPVAMFNDWLHITEDAPLESELPKAQYCE